MLDTGMAHPASPSRKDLLPSHRECGQQTGSNCQFLKGLPRLQRPMLSEAHSPWGHLYPVIKERRGYEAQTYWPAVGHFSHLYLWDFNLWRCLSDDMEGPMPLKEEFITYIS